MIKKNPLLLFAIALGTILILPAIFRDGMFADGLLYSLISRNLSEGIGTVWHPLFSPVFTANHFHEQLPLMFWLQSFFFHLFSGIYPERVYDLVFAVLNVWIILRIWKRIFRTDEKFSRLNGLPLLLYFLSPVTMWAFTNNVEEITMGFFVLASVDAQLAAMIENRKKQLNLFLAIAWTICASLCKGPQGLFAITFPAILWMTGRIPLKRALVNSIVFFAALAAFYAILLSIPYTKETFTSWYANRIEKTFAHGHDTSSSHFHLLFELLLDMLPLLGFSLVIFLFGRKAAWNTNSFRWGNAFLLLALAGSLPLMVTLEQRGFYLFTAIPFYVLAIACYLAPYFSVVHEKLFSPKTARTIFNSVSLLVIIAALVLTFIQAGTPKRDAELLHDIRLTAPLIGEKGTVIADDEIYNNWAVMNYYQRMYHIDLNTDTSDKHAQYFLSKSGNAPAGWEATDLQTQFFKVYKRSVGAVSP